MKSTLKGIEILGKQAEELGANIRGEKRLVTFELMRLPTSEGGKFPEVEWHRDVGFLHTLDEQPFCYSDYTTVIMLTQPNWKGGHLCIEKNGVSNGDRPPKKGTSTTERIQYLYNEAVTFHNRDARHSVTPIESKKGGEDRIIFIASLFNKTRTNAFCNEHQIA